MTCDVEEVTCEARIPSGDPVETLGVDEVVRHTRRIHVHVVRAFEACGEFLPRNEAGFDHDPWNGAPRRIPTVASEVETAATCIEDDRDLVSLLQERRGDPFDAGYADARKPTGASQSDGRGDSDAQTRVGAWTAPDDDGVDAPQADARRAEECVQSWNQITTVGCLLIGHGDVDGTGWTPRGDGETCTAFGRVEGEEMGGHGRGMSL